MVNHCLSELSQKLILELLRSLVLLDKPFLFTGPFECLLPEYCSLSILSG